MAPCVYRRQNKVYRSQLYIQIYNIDKERKKDTRKEKEKKGELTENIT